MAGVANVVNVMTARIHELYTDLKDQPSGKVDSSNELVAIREGSTP